MISDETFKKISDEVIPTLRAAVKEMNLEGLVSPAASMTAEVLLEDGTWANVRVTVELDPEDDENEGEELGDDT